MANVYVTEVVGQGASLGEIPAKFGIATNLGHIMYVSGDLLYVASGDQDGWVYKQDVMVTEQHATDFWGWPTGVGVITYDRRSNYPNGFVMNFHSVTGSTYMTGNGPVSFGR